MPVSPHQYLALKLTPDEWQFLFKEGSEHSYDKDEIVFNQGDSSISFFYLKSGAVDVLSDDEVIIQLSAPCVFGEMALFNSEVRSATLKATAKLEVVEIPTKNIFNLIAQHDQVALKLIHNLGRLMVHRIEDAEKKLAKTGKAQTQAIQKLMKFKKDLMSNWSIQYHTLGEPGKISVISSKPVGTPEDLSIAYSPGVAAPCISINEDELEAYNITTKGNLVGIITNGTAVLGLGTLNPVAAKPVMEGKAVLFKTFANINAFDLEVNERSPDKFIDIVKALEPTFGGINLEDIKAPECFYIEKTLIEAMKIPVFHDDQHGTAIIVGAGLINALKITKKKMEDIKVVCCGAGAAGFSCAKYLISLGVDKNNLQLVDAGGLVTLRRELDDYLKELAVDDDEASLEQVIAGADVFVGLSAGNILTPEMLLSMNENPIVFALANPIPEIGVQLAKNTRKDVIIATGRSDYPNQINNVMAFPFIFRGALDVRATKINEEMKKAATNAIIELTQEKKVSRDYIVPKPFEPHLLSRVAFAVAKTAIETGVAQLVLDLKGYKKELIYIENQLRREFL